jgi:hypothetical protein
VSAAPFARETYVRGGERGNIEATFAEERTQRAWRSEAVAVGIGPHDDMSIAVGPCA